MNLTARKRDSRLQHMEVLYYNSFNLETFVWDHNGFATKVTYSYVLLIKATYPVVVSYSLLFVSFSGRSDAISTSYRSVGFFY